jgi:hypothetical protein
MFEAFILGILMAGVSFGSFINPLPIGYLVDFCTPLSGTHGWIKTFGLKGTQSIDGWFYGAMFGFTGIKILSGKENKDFKFLGFSSQVILGTEE